MKKFSPGKLKVIIVLNFAIIALLIGLFFYFPPGDDNITDVGGTPTTHERIRTAQISLNPALSWELNLCGSGTEDAVAVFLHEDYLYIFGNTSSSDLDFDRAGVFLAIVDTYGVTKAFYIYGESGDTLKAACYCEGGFLLALQTADSPKMLVVDFTGEVKKTLSQLFYGFESVVGVKYYNGGYFMFSQPQNSLTGVRSLRCTYFTVSGSGISGIEFATSSVATSPYSLDPVDSAVVSGKVVAVCSATSSLHTVPALVEFAQNDSPKIRLFTDYPGTVKGFSIYDGDFLLLTTQEGSTLLQISAIYTVIKKTTLSQLKALGISEIGEKDGEMLYLVFLDTAVYITTAKGERKHTLSAFAPAGTPYSSAYLNGAMVYTGSSGSTANAMVNLNIYNNQKVLLSAFVGEGQNPLMVLDENNLFCVYHKGGDVLISKLRYPLFNS